MRYRLLDDEATPSGVATAGEPAIKHGAESALHVARLVAEKNRRQEHFRSYELCPTDADGVYRRFFSETSECAPIFYSLTWHSEAERADVLEQPAMRCIGSFPRNTLLHLAARGLTRDDVQRALERALELGVANVLALQGDGNSSDGDFPYAVDLVRFIRERFAQQFCICVAGYPEVHPHSTSKDFDLQCLKAKIDAGSDLIITQCFFDSHIYVEFVKDCEKAGISVPIIPGIFPFTNVKSLYNMMDICRTNIPSWIKEKLQQIEGDDEAVRQFGIDLSVKIIKEIQESGIFYGYHLFTLNKPFSAVQIHRQLMQD